LIKQKVREKKIQSEVKKRSFYFEKPYIKICFQHIKIICSLTIAEISQVPEQVQKNIAGQQILFRPY